MDPSLCRIGPGGVFMRAAWSGRRIHAGGLVRAADHAGGLVRAADPCGSGR
ncbi:unnamed protein product, partial [Nesidiocoris tenuis]